MEKEFTNKEIRETVKYLKKFNKNVQLKKKDETLFISTGSKVFNVECTEKALIVVKDALNKALDVFGQITGKKNIEAEDVKAFGEALVAANDGACYIGLEILTERIRQQEAAGEQE